MGFDDLVNKAKDIVGMGGEKAADGAAAGSSGIADQIKAVATDENIDKAAEAIKGITPDSIDGHVDTAAAKAKEMNN